MPINYYQFTNDFKCYTYKLYNCYELHYIKAYTVYKIILQHQKTNDLKRINC